MKLGRKTAAFILALSYYFAALVIPMSHPTDFTKGLGSESSKSKQEVFATVNLLSSTVYEVKSGTTLSLNNPNQTAPKHLVDNRFAFCKEAVFTKENKLKIADVLYRFTRFRLFPFHSFW